MGIRAKVILFVVGLVVVIFTSLGTVSLHLQRNIYDAEMYNRGLSLLEALSIPIALALANMEIETLDQYVAQIVEGGKSAPLDIRSVMVMDYEGRVVAHTDPDEFGKKYGDAFTRNALLSSRPSSQTESLNGRTWMKVSLPVVSGKRWGTLISVFNTEKIEERIASSRWHLISYTLIFSILAGVGVFAVLSRLVVKPIVELSEASRDIQKGNLDRRVTVRSGKKDEMEHLKQGFNRMAEELQEYTKGLEAKVEERTRKLAETNKDLLRAQKQLQELAITDGLTGAFNHRHLKHTLTFEMQRQKRKTHPLCYLMIDVDDFKLYNDTHGHPAGDEALRIITRLFKDHLREIDFVARYGGEEFAILLLDTQKEEGIPVAEKLCRIVETCSIPLEESQPGGRLTISVGLACFPVDANDMNSLIRIADAALYRAKQKGKNRIEYTA